MIPGYDEAVAKEQRLRELAYLGVPWDACGIKVKQITPHLLTMLSASGNPFVCGGVPLGVHVTQFLWLLSPDYSTSAWAMWRFRRKVRKLDLVSLATSIQEFVQVTFMDQPNGRLSVPYACSSAWIEHRMWKDYGWKWEYTKGQPLRRIYGLLRCKAQDAGVVLINSLSDKKRQDYLDSINDPEAVAAFMEKRGQN